MIINDITPIRPPWAKHPIPGHHDCARCGGYGTTDFGAPCPTGIWTGIKLRHVIGAAAAFTFVYLLAALYLIAGGA